MNENGNNIPDLQQGPTFEEMVNLDSWQPVEEFFAEADDLISADVQEAVKLRHQLRDELLSGAPELAERIRRPNEETLNWARPKTSEF